MAGFPAVPPASRSATSAPRQPWAVRSRCCATATSSTSTSPPASSRSGSRTRSWPHAARPGSHARLASPADGWHATPGWPPAPIQERFCNGESEPGLLQNGVAWGVKRGVWSVISLPSHSLTTAPKIRRPASVIRHLTFAIRLFCFPIPRCEFLLPHFPKGFERLHQLAVPGRLVAAVPLECRAAIQRRAVVPLGGLVGLDLLMLGQQLLEPADVPLDNRADE